MPNSAAFPVPDMIATGVARPRAQGQEITKTVMAEDRANSKDCPASSHTAAVTRAIRMTAGTKIPLTRSASLAMGALEFPASSTNRIICARVVSLPTREA